MGFFSKVTDKIKKAIPKEAAPFLPALAAIYGGPMLSGMFGGGAMGGGIGAFLADLGTQELTSDNTKLESALVSGVFGGARGAKPNSKLMTEGVKGRGPAGGASLNGNYSRGTSELLKGDAYQTAYDTLGPGQKALESVRKFAMAPTFEGQNTPFSMAGLTSIGMQATPKIGYEAAEQMNRNLASQAAASAKSRQLSYDESMKYAKQYYYGSNPDATDEDFNQFMNYYNSDLSERLEVADGGRIGFAGGSNYQTSDYEGSIYDRFPEAQVGTFINEERYTSEKIDKLEKKMNDLYNMRLQKRKGEDFPQKSFMEEVIEKEILNLGAEREKRAGQKTRQEAMDQAAAESEAAAERRAQQQQAAYLDMFGDGLNRTGRAMGGIMRPNYNMGGMMRQNYNMGGTHTMPDGSIMEGGYADGGRIGAKDGRFFRSEFLGANQYDHGPTDVMGSSQMMPMTDEEYSLSRDGFAVDPEAMKELGIDGLLKRILSGSGTRSLINAFTGGDMDRENLGKDMNMGGTHTMPDGSIMEGAMHQDRPNFNYGSGRQTPQGDPIAPNVPPGMQMDLRPGGFIELGTEPRADDVPAMVGKDEFVLNDRSVAGIGKLITGQPDARAGARALYELQEKMEATV